MRKSLMKILDKYCHVTSQTTETVKRRKTRRNNQFIKYDEISLSARLVFVLDE